MRLSDAIIQPKEVYGALARILEEVPEDNVSEIRAQTLAVIREVYDRERESIRSRFAKDGDHRRAIRRASTLIDQLIATLFQFAGNHLFRQEKGHLKNRLAVVAVGGYGRKELFPHSDVDLLFLHAEEEWDEASKIAEFILYMLWDLGIQVGQAVRTVDEALELAGQDATVSTNLLDARVVCGNRKLFQRFSSRFWEEVAHEGTILSYVEAKLDERNLRHTRCGDSRYVLEPNIKDGKGGLRDLHTLYWLARYVYRVRRIRELVERGVLSQEEYRAYKRAQKFLGLVRTHLHLESGRAEERLTFDMQRVLAEKLGYHDRGNMLAVERFMKAYFLTAKSVGNLTRVFCSVLEDERKHKRRVPFSGLFTGRHKLQGFVLEGGRVAVPDSDFFDEHPPRLISLFAVAQEHDLDIHPQTLRLVSRKLGLIDKAFRNNPEANALFVDILTSPKQPDVALRRMNEAGVLGRFIRDFGRIVGQMQFDTYHVYTVDEHTIFAIGILSQIASGKHRDTFPLASRLIEQIASKRALYLAVFCHDISKGQGGDHSTLGERVARKLAKRFGFDPEEVETAAWLVRLHLLFSHTAFKRDIAEDKTIADFVAKVQSPERLRLLLLLTVVDIRAVGPNVWNSWKGALMRDLYARAEAFMGAADAPPMVLGEALTQALKQALPDWSAIDIAEYLSAGSEAFFSGLSVESHVQAAQLLHKAQQNAPSHVALEVSVNQEHAITSLLIATEDRKALFAYISGALTSIGANIVNAKVFTLKNGMAIEQFFVQDLQGNAYDHPDRIARLESMLGSQAGETAFPPAKIARRASRLDVFKIPPRVIIENNVSSHHTVVEVNGRDRPGFLYTITKTLAELELGISTAHISSYGLRAVDVFYVKDKFGMKVASESKLKQIREHLIAALKQDGKEKESVAVTVPEKRKQTA